MQPSPDFNPAVAAKKLLREGRSGALATLMPGSGDPYCSLVNIATAADGAPLFAIDNRGSDLFVELVYAGEIGPGFTFSIDGETFTGLDRDVAFVALKNGRHNGIGYFLDSAASPDSLPAPEFPLAEIHSRILDAFNAAGCGTPAGSVAAAASGR